MKKNRPLKSKMILIFTMLLSAFLSMQTIEVNASHFRGGTITWQQAGGNSITFTVNTQWRRSAFGGQTVGSTNNIGTFYYGDGTTAIMIATVNATNIANDESFMTWTITKTYASSGNFTASAFTDIAGGICCRINGVLDGNNGGYRLETVVNVGGPPFNNPPVTSLPAIVNLPVGAANATFTIPGSDPDNNPLTFRVSTTAESGLSTIQPAGFNLSSNGTATMNTTTRVVGNQFAVQVMILDGRTKTPVDFIIRMVAASAPPVFIAPSPAQNAIFNVTPPGNNINFTVAATDPDAGQTTTLNSVALPLGAAMSPALPVTSSASGVIQSTFNWTPTAAQVGSYVVNFVAQDNVGIQSFRTITINVQCPLSITVTGTVIPTCVNTNNGSISVSVQNFSTSSNLRYLWTGPGTFTSTQQNLSGLSSGTYNLRVDDVGTGCFSLTTINLNSINASPTISCPTNITVSNDPGLCGANVSFTGANAATANGTPTPSISYSPASGSFFPVGTTTVTATANNSCGNVQCTFTVVVNDNQPPETPTLANVTGECSATATVPTTTDNCAGTINGTTNDPLSYSTQGTHVIHWTFNDGNGNSITVNQNVIVDDVTDPATPTLANVTGECSATATVPTTTDNCAGTINGTTTDALSYNTQGTHVIHWTFNDGNGNSTTANQNVIINDVTNPVITCPANTFIQYGSNESPSANGTASATDNCVVVSVGTPTDATVPGPGNNKTITRTWTATDIANNTASCNQIITVCDLSLSLGNNRYVFFGIPGLPGTTAVITATPSGGLTGVTYLWSSIQNPSVNGLTTQSITPTGYTDGQAVTYTVTATAPNGCTATKSVTITYFNINCSNNNNNVKVKVCHIPQGNPTNCNTICVSINAYQTLLNNGSYLGNCLPNCAMPPQTRGGVTDISQYLVGKQTLDVKVFNNPTQSYFGLFVYGDFYQRVSLRVIDMYGRVIDQKNNLNTEQEIRIGEGYIAGVYVVEVIQGVNKKVVKLVKQ